MGPEVLFFPVDFNRKDWLTKRAFLHVWFVDLKEWDAGSEDVEKILSEADKKQAQDRKHPEAKAEFIKGRLFLRKVLASYLDCSENEVALEYGEQGKPTLCGNPTIRFNLGHSGGKAALAVSDRGEVGVDIERFRAEARDKNYERIAQRFFSDEERAWLSKKQFSPSAFLRLWTLRESLVKCTGGGVWAEFKDLVLPYDPKLDFFKAPAGFETFEILTEAGVYTSVSIRF